MSTAEPDRPDEVFRPAFHFTAPEHRINDPNGLVFHAGEYHLFHQLEIGGMLHWGHAVSTDLVSWRPLPVALHPDGHGHIYSGSVVVDHGNCSGLGVDGAPLMVAFFTYHSLVDGTETQALAYSVDHGRSWTKHPDNPVVANPGLRDFRDPKVFWHDPTGAWVMVLAAGDHVRFLRSVDLLHWEHASVWGAGQGAQTGFWECPDLFELPISGTDRTRWVLSVSVSDGAPAGGSGMQYFVGSFDGFCFSNDDPPTRTRWQNWGSDFYAGVTWENVPAGDGRRLMIAWADNWRYRDAVPTYPLSGQLTVVRELSLVDQDGDVRLVHAPAREIETLRGEAASWPVSQVEGHYELRPVSGDAYEVLVEFDDERSSATGYGVDVHVGQGEVTRIGFDTVKQVVYVDRRDSGIVPCPEFAARHEAPCRPVDGRLRLRALVDSSLVEVFINDTEQIVDLVLPSKRSRGLRLFADDGRAEVLSLTVHPLAPVTPGSGDETQA